eukprot:TRINITY_DN783_c0_g2_i5.p1 TRINITY_DN783_c0_g2~~TRINITY_DN783_c0_g2_i5.p1  ORF type:complete len:164 (+),score=10.32 TRINITY_DN783_c0_g2_i5:693-1184(+)
MGLCTRGQSVPARRTCSSRQSRDGGGPHHGRSCVQTQHAHARRTASRCCGPSLHLRRRGCPQSPRTQSRAVCGRPTQQRRPNKQEVKLDGDEQATEKNCMAADNNTTHSDSIKQCAEKTFAHEENPPSFSLMNPQDDDMRRRHETRRDEGRIKIKKQSTEKDG